MPGAWRCPRCNFTLQLNVIYVNGIAADTTIADRACPNDGELMLPLTWREANEEIYAAYVKEVQRMNWLDENCSFVANHEFNLGPFKVGELRKLADAGIAVKPWSKS